MSRAKSFQLVISPNFSAAGILRPVKYRSSILRENLLFSNIRVSAYSIQLQKYSDGYLTTTLKFAHETTRDEISSVNEIRVKGNGDLRDMERIDRSWWKLDAAENLRGASNGSH